MVEQFDEDTGPTLTAARSSRQIVLHDVVPGPGRYEGFRAAAHVAGVTAVVSTSLAGRGLLGSLTCYSTSATDFDDAAAETALGLARAAGRLVELEDGEPAGSGR